MYNTTQKTQILMSFMVLGVSLKKVTEVENCHQTLKLNWLIPLFSCECNDHSVHISIVWPCHIIIGVASYNSHMYDLSSRQNELDLFCI